MFAIEPHEDGFLVSWESGDADAAAVIGDDLFFGGLRRTLDTKVSFVVLRYRNELETLRSLTRIFTTRGLHAQLDKSLTLQRYFRGQ